LSLNSRAEVIFGRDQEIRLAIAFGISGLNVDRFQWISTFVRLLHCV